MTTAAAVAGATVTAAAAVGWTPAAEEAPTVAVAAPTRAGRPATARRSRFFAITGHEHRFGTGVKVWTATGESDPGTLVYGPEPFLWEEPETTYHDPPFTVPAGGGFKFQCDWDDTSDSAVGFGESANQEMCFFWAYYYPGTGSKVCFVTDQVGGTSGCCPGHFGCSFL